MNKAERLVSIFGSGQVMGREIGVDPTLITRWKKRGFIPPHHNTRILEAAERLELDLDQVTACLERNVCPCCGQRMPEGQVVDRRFMFKRNQAA